MKFTNEEIRLGLIGYNYLCAIENRHNKQVIQEIKFNLKGLKNLTDKAKEKFQGLDKNLKVFTGLVGRLSKLSKKDPKEVISFIKNNAKKYKGKSYSEIKKDADKIYNDFTGKEVNEAIISDTNKRIRAALLAALMIFSIGSNAIEKNTSTINDFAGDVTTTISQDVTSDTSDAAQFTSDNDSGDDDNDVSITPDNSSLVSFETGEYNTSPSDIDVAAKKIADQVKSNAKDTNSKITLNPFGKISNTPGDQDNNPTGKATDGLDQLRLDTGKKIADKAAEILQSDGYDNVEVGEGSTNINNTGDEVAKNSKEAKANQTAGATFDIEDVADEVPDDAPPPPPPDIVARIQSPKLTMDNRSRFLVMQSIILPLLVDDYTKLIEDMISVIKITDSDFPITRKYMEEKVAELNKLPIDKKTDKVKNTIKILNWSIHTSKYPDYLRNNIYNLDPNTKLGKREKRNSSGGPAGKNMGNIMGKRGNIAGEQEPGVEKNTVTESLLLEGKADFSELPNYNKTKAKKNLGILIPVYVAYWPTTYDGDYIEKTYPESYRKFEKDYPVINNKINSTKYLPLDQSKSDGEKKGKDKSKPSQDKKAKKIPSDTKNVIQNIAKDNLLVKQLRKLDNEIEIAQFLSSLYSTYNTVPPSDKKIVVAKTASTSNPITLDTSIYGSNYTSTIAEEESSDIPNLKPDTEKVLTFLDKDSYKRLRTYLSKVNTRDELESLIPYLRPFFGKNVYNVDKNGKEINQKDSENKFNMITKRAMKIFNNSLKENKFRGVVRNYIKQLITEQEEEFRGMEEMPSDESEMISRFPKLKDALLSLMGKDYQAFISDIKYIAPKPTTFQIDLGDENFNLMWAGNKMGFVCEVQGKKYYLVYLSEKQQAIKAINRLLRLGATTPEESENEEGDGEIGGVTPGEEESFSPPPPEDSGDEGGVSPDEL
jgi:hypothetical protein